MKTTSEKMRDHFVKGPFGLTIISIFLGFGVGAIVLFFAGFNTFSVEGHKKSRDPVVITAFFGPCDDNAGITDRRVGNKVL